LFPKTTEIVKQSLWQDAKSFFQEKAQAEYNTTPNYKLLESTGPDHDKVFVTGVRLGNDRVATGEGRSKQESEQAAAEKAIAAKGW
jgi:ribonuclease-3